MGVNWLRDCPVSISNSTLAVPLPNPGVSNLPDRLLLICLSSKGTGVCGQVTVLSQVGLLKLSESTVTTLTLSSDPLRPRFCS